MNAPKPDSQFEAVLWWSMALFYLVGALTVASWCFEAPLRFTIAGLVATGFTHIGAWHAREIHVNNRVGQGHHVPSVNPSEDLFPKS